MSPESIFKTKIHLDDASQLQERPKTDVFLPTTSKPQLTPRAADRVPTGIPNLDDLIEGGIEQGSAVLVAGEAGSGKSTFALQFIYNGATQYDEPGIYITFEEPKVNLFRDMLKLGMDFETLEKQKKVTILEYAPHEIDRFVNEGQIVEDLINQMGAKRLVIDSISTFALIFDNDYKRKQALFNLLRAMRKWGTTTVLTTEGILKHGVMHTKFSLSYMTDGVFFLYNIRQGDTRIRAFEIAKLRGTRHSANIMPFEIGPNGIVLYPDQPVFANIGGRSQF